MIVVIKYKKAIIKKINHNHIWHKDKATRQLNIAVKYGLNYKNMIDLFTLSFFRKNGIQLYHSKLSKSKNESYKLTYSKIDVEIYVTIVISGSKRTEQKKRKIIIFLIFFVQRSKRTKKFFSLKNHNFSSHMQPIFTY